MPFNNRRRYFSGNRYRTRMERDLAAHMGHMHRSETADHSCNSHGRIGPNREQWFRVVIPSGQGAGKSVISTTINDYSKKPIQVLNFYSDPRTGRITFYVHSREEADEIRSLGKTVCIQGKPTSIIVHRVDEPTYQLDPESTELLKEFIQSRYMPQLDMLDLSSVVENNDLHIRGIYINLRRMQSCNQTMTLAEELFPATKVLDLSSNMLTSLEFLRNRFKSVERLNVSRNQIHRLRELDYLKHMKLLEINIQDNPLCTQFSNVDDLSSVVREKQSRLAVLNGITLPPMIGFAVDDDNPTLPETLCHFVPEDLKPAITHFIKLYFELFDSSNRQSLINAYHENAVLSLSINSQRAFRFDKYVKEGRNFLKINEESLRYERLKRGRCDIVSLFVRFPSTEHDLATFKVDVFQRKSDSFSISIQGLFKEEVDLSNQKDRDRYFARSFCRVFQCVVESGGIIIVSEHLHIRDATEVQAKSVLNKAASEPQRSQSQPTAQPAKTEASHDAMIESMMKTTGMNWSYSEQCLTGNNWNFDQACRNFLELKSKDMIPKEAFTIAK